MKDIKYFSTISELYEWLEENHVSGFRANAKAWEFFETQAAYYRRTAVWWVISAKHEETRLKRLGKLISKSKAGEKV